MNNQQVHIALNRALSALIHQQHADGHWVFEFEADASMTAEYVLLMHFLGEPISSPLREKLSCYLRSWQQSEGGWPLMRGESSNPSVSVKAYFALKLLGDSAQAAHMQRARGLIHKLGGAANSNVMLRIWLALYGIIPWQAVPLIPVEVILLPRWFPFHLSRICSIPRKYALAFAVLSVLRPMARNPEHIHLDELFILPSAQTRPLARAAHQSPMWFGVFSVADRLLHLAHSRVPRFLRQRAMGSALKSVTGQLNGEDGYGASLPTIAMSLMVLQAAGYDRNHPGMIAARRACEKLLVIKPHAAFCQPCLSPVWDTAWACHALLESGTTASVNAALQGLAWLGKRQILDVYGNGSVARQNLRPGGWAFQYALPDLPDVDDTALVAAAMSRALELDPDAPYVESIAWAREWIEGMQSRNGGWGAYEVDNTQYYLNSVPFAEHGLMIDPPTADISARCLSLFGQLGRRANTHPAVSRALIYLLAEQQADGSWFGRWGINFVYGTWSALEGLAAIGHDPQSRAMQSARDWLLQAQNADGGWGEGASGYDACPPRHCRAASTPSQTAWALLGLMACAQADHSSVASGIAYLLRSQNAEGRWTDPHATGVAIPRALYTHYHGYALYFPLMALARYARLTQHQTPAPTPAHEARRNDG